LCFRQRQRLAKEHHDMQAGNRIFLTQSELAARFRVSPRTLERWRWLKTGPNYHKLGGKIAYALTDVESYERRRRAETHSSILGSWE
jgi:hypothetical protein